MYSWQVKWQAYTGHNIETHEEMGLGHEKGSSGVG